MENEDDPFNSLPYIDDEIVPSQYNLKIIENYEDQSRNIEISNRYPSNSLSPVSPLPEQTEVGDNILNHFRKEDPRKQVRCHTPSNMKLVIKGWNSSISIQGLDNKSSITFKRACDKMHHKKVDKNEEKKTKPIGDESKSMKGRWKMLTRSLMLAKARRGLDERYPKYVLLKNEDEELTKVKENYPKMFVFNDKTSKQKRNIQPKPEFNFKKSFKNKTEPIVPLEVILAKPEETTQKETVKKQRPPLTERCHREKNVMIKKRIVVERRKSLATENMAARPRPQTQNNVCREIQGIIEDTLKLLPPGAEMQQTVQEDTRNPADFMPPQFCHDPYCCLRPHDQALDYIPVYTPGNHVYRNRTEDTMNADLENLSFGILSSFFPRVVIMNAIPNDELPGDEGMKRAEGFSGYGLPKSDEPKDLQQEEAKVIDNLQIPPPDLTLKSKMVQQPVEPELENLPLSDLSRKDSISSDEAQKTKTQESEATTEYLQYCEFDSSGNESIERHETRTPPPKYETKEKEKETLFSEIKIEKEDENSESLSLTKIGYKMYDNLTKLSLNRENETPKKPEMLGCGCNGNGTKRSPYNITLESNNGVVKVTVPENELKFQISNTEGPHIQIGVLNEEEDQVKKIVRRKELWHCNGGGNAVALQSRKTQEGDDTAFQKLKLSLGDNKNVVFSIEMKGKEEKKEETSRKEMKVGTDDLDVAGGDFVSTLGGNYKNLSPRIGRLLKHLHEKLETDEKERKFLDEKINRKLLDQKCEGGIYLVKQISPTAPAKTPAQVPSLRKPKKPTEDRAGQLREYYCEECLATMRIFEDENPSVKSMVDKFETIIQLESC